MAEIKLKSGASVLVDDEDVHLFDGSYVRLDKGGYPIVRTSKSRWSLVSRVITDAPRDKVVDHANHNLLDNRRSNLRVTTIQNNSRNRHKKKGPSSSSFKGVYKKNRHWCADIRVDRGVSLWLGRFASELEAARAYDLAALKHHGEFALINGVDESIKPKRLDTTIHRRWSRPRQILDEPLPFDEFW